MPARRPAAVSGPSVHWSVTEPFDGSLGLAKTCTQLAWVMVPFDATPAGVVAVHDTADAGMLWLLAGPRKNAESAFTEMLKLSFFLKFTVLVNEMRIDAGTPGVLTSSGKISILATTAADLSPLVTDSGDAITLGVGQNYTLNPAQLGVASVYTPASGNTAASLSIAGDLTAAGVVTLRADASADLSTLTATGIDAIALTVGRDYTMTTAQANMATVGTGAVGALSKAGNITLKPSGAGENFATSLANVSGYDTLQLNEAVNYSLTAAQAAIARIGPLGTVGNLVSTGVVAVTATGSADLSGLLLDSGDSVLLTRGNFNYTLSAAQAAIASMTGSGANSLPGQLAHSSGTVTVVANP